MSFLDVFSRFCHVFFISSVFSEAALLPTVDDEPLTPGSVTTQDSWSFDGRR